MSAADTIAFIPARAGSKGLAGKNTRPLLGRPLYVHAVEQAWAAGLDRVVISTDVDEIVGTDHGPGVRVVERPASLAGDRVTMAEVLLDYLDRVETGEGVMVLLQPTSPLRTGDDIRAAVDLYRSGGWDMVMSVTGAERGVLKWGTIEGGEFKALRAQEHMFANRQALPPVHRPNGAIYVFGAGWLRQARSLAAGRIGAFEMPQERSYDIDTAADFDRCEELLRQRGET